MINAQLVLAQTGAAADVSNPSLVQIAEAFKGHLDLLCQPQAFMEPLISLHMIWAVVFVFIGGLSVFNGNRWHKTLVILLAAMGGAMLGMALGPQINANSAIAGAAGAALLAIVSFPLMRYSVAVLAGLAGSFAGANVWTSITADSSQHVFGAIIGLIVFGMFAFLAYRVAIIAFTSIFGAVLLTTGVLSAMLKITAMQTSLGDSLAQSPRVLPIIVGVVALIGFVIQQSGGFKGMNAAADRADPSKSGKAKPAAEPQGG